jgi:ABC-type nitrate/sulfonate/bicarbonate transport system substrate-binding protein
LIASPSATSTYSSTFKAAAESQGAKIRFTYMAQPAMVAALQTGAIQGMVVGAPLYAKAILNGTGVIWMSGPKGEIPAQFSSANAVTLNTKRQFAEANRDLVARLAAVFADLSDAVVNRPNDVKAAIMKLFPEIDQKTMDLIYETESNGFHTKPVTVADMAHEIAYLKLSGVPLPNADKLNPASMIFH